MIITPICETSMVEPIKFGMDKQFHSTPSCACGYLSVLRLKLNHVNKMGHKKLFICNMVYFLPIK